MNRRVLLSLLLCSWVGGCVRDTPGYCEDDPACPPEQHCDTVAFACVDGPQRAQVFTALLEGGPVSGALKLTLGTDERRLLFDLQHSVPDPTAAHLHRGAKGEIGPVLCTLGAGKDQERGVCAVRVEGGAEDLLLRDLRGGLVYADVHSAERPEGAIRGQVVLSSN